MNLRQYIQTPQRGLFRLKEFILDQGVKRNIFSGHQDYQKFILLGYYRTGSNFLNSLLNSNKEVVTFSEPFSESRIFWGNGVYAEKELNPSTLAFRNEQPVEFVNKYLFRNYSSNIQAVGFKFLYPHLEDPRFKSVVDYVLKNDVKIIHLKRNDLLSIRLSTRIMGQTKQALITNEAQAKKLDKVKAFEIEYDHLKEELEHLDQRMNYFSSLFSDSDLIEVFYEDLQANTQNELDRISSFLGIKSSPAFTILKKQRKKPIREMVSNFEELKEKFADTKWAYLFENR